MGRYDLAVNFACDITFVRQKNEILIDIANTCIGNSDLVTAEKAISGITFVQQRNELSMKLLGIVSGNN